MVHCEGGTTVIIPPNALRAVRQLRDLSCFWTRFRELAGNRRRSGSYHAGACWKLGSASSNDMTPWPGLQLEGLHYAKTGVIEQD